ncbi:TlpA disulfide reductase family protein [Mucilaginibacter segetis]|uniref:AhpC/TSA family protein n=1 Tax=Mucilaginibacter segetis TaxID=2793071 RepID=A0A934UMC6_9SPHI|nr:TlpA disulfide reductase family protein [Mucilaginibacter segetis]MBK0378895.1 AhpC/TSA family protein [Mucilaginibacter segetis]
MRSLLLISFLFLTCTFCYGQQIAGRFFVHGNFFGSHIKTITFNYNDADSGHVIKRCPVIDQHFTFSGSVSEPTLVYVTGDTATNDVDDVNYSEFFIEPGNIQITLREDHFKEMKVSGSKTQDEKNKLEQSKQELYHLQRPLDSLLSEYNKMLRNISYEDTLKYNAIADRRAGLITKIKKYTRQGFAIDRRFIASHPASYLSPYLLYLQFHSQNLKIDSTRLYYDKISPLIKQSLWGRELARRLDILGIGEQFPDIKGVSTENKQLSIPDLKKSDYTLVVMWASWCVPCRENAPRLMKLFNKYHSKGLNIIAISADSSKKDWLAAIKEDKLQPWQHLLADLHGGIVHKLGLYGIPAEILLKNGVIINKYSGADNNNTGLNSLESKLDQIFVNN